MQVLKKTLLSQSPKPQSAWVGVISLLAFFLISFVYWQDPYDLSQYLSASGSDVFAQHEYWRLFTTIAAHADFQHLLSNSFFFGGLSYLIHAYFGSLAFPILSLAAGILINALSLATYPAQAHLVGASGVVYFMAAFWLTMYFWIDTRQTKSNRLVNCIALTLMLLFPETYEPAVSYRTHAIGFLTGIPVASFYYVTHRDEIRRADVYEEKSDENDPTDISSEVNVG